MRLPKRDQFMLAEAYDQITDQSVPLRKQSDMPADYPMKQDTQPKKENIVSAGRQDKFNAERQLNQIEIKLSNRGFKRDEAGRYDFFNDDDTIKVQSYQRRDGQGIGVILKRSSYAGIIFLIHGVKYAQKQLDGKWNTIEDLKEYYDVYDPSEAAEWLNFMR